MKLSLIRIVLVATSHPGNIGATARAMKTMGLTKLYLITPKLFPNEKATAMAAGADDILAQCQVVSSLLSALVGCRLVIATSARPRALALPSLIPADCAKLINEQTNDTEVAIVFGREQSGLTNDELLYCHFHVTIPSNPDYSSLNVAQAVQIIAYELRMRLISAESVVTDSQKTLATIEEVEQCYTHLVDVMLAIHCLKPNNPGRVLKRVRRLFTRARLESMEVAMLRGFLSQIQKMIYTIHD